MDRQPRAAVVFGARNLGRAVIERLVADGWGVVGVARSPSTLEGVAAAGATPLAGDITDAASVRDALRLCATAHGSVALVVNAASPYGGSDGPFGGGRLVDADPQAFEAWTAIPARAAFTFLSAAGAFLVEQGMPATIVQVTGGSTRRAMPGRGLWAAGCFGVRALTNTAALELRERGIHVALLVVDAAIAPVGAGGDDRHADPRRLADAVVFLAAQDARGATHDLQITPLAESWTP